LDEDYRVAMSISLWLKQLLWYWWRLVGVIEGIRVYSSFVILATGVSVGLFVLRFKKTILPSSIIFFLGVLPVMGLYAIVRQMLNIPQTGFEGILFFVILGLPIGVKSQSQLPKN